MQLFQIKKCFIFILYCLFPFITCSLKSNYYENLIKQETEAAQHYELPKNNAEFKEGISSSTVKDFGSYDFIVVGAGSAGSVLATRLSEINDFSVLLIEAGGEETDFTKIPNLLHNIMFSDKNWGYYTTPQKNCCLGMKNKQCHIPRGKVLGGCSSINGMIYSRGVPGDYNHWVEMGNDGWSYEEVLPYFRKSENSQINEDKEYHGVGGLWNVEYAKPSEDIVDTLIEACVQANHSIIDYNGAKTLGVGRQQLNTKNGVRQSTNTAFLSNARKRKNLKVLTKALVTKLLITKSKECAGVEFVTNNKKFKVSAKKEVIVSGGAINSPQILMLSGIGPKEHLEQIGVEVVADLPVGKQLLEHPLFPAMILRTTQNFTTKNLTQLVEEYLRGEGLFTYPLGTDFVSFHNPKGKMKNRIPLEYMFSRADGVTPSVMERVLNFNNDTMHQLFDSFNPTTDLLASVALLHEKSRGQLTLKSSSPLDFPNIDLNFFSEKEDIETLIEGIEFVRNLSNTESFQKIGGHFLDSTLCKGVKKYSFEYWECLIRHVGATVFHPCGTTPMGTNQLTSVVDPHLKVHGIGKLRVVDAGVMPSTISGHTNAPTVMIAEKISDAIKQDYGYSDSSLEQCQQQSFFMHNVKVHI